jgi:hypothetical protein
MAYDAEPANGVVRHNQYVGAAYAANALRLQIPLADKRISPAIVFYRTADSATDGKAAYYTTVWNSATDTVAENITDKGFTSRVSGSGFAVAGSYLVSVGWAADAEL